MPTLENYLPHLQEILETESHNYEEGEMEFFGETLGNLEGFIEYKRENM